MPAQQPYTILPDGLKLHIRLQPKASKNAIDGIEVSTDGRCYIRARVTAVPEQGKANKALIKLLAKSWRVPASDLKLIVGDKSRNKTVLWRGDHETLTAALRDLVSFSSDGAAGADAKRSV